MDFLSLGDVHHVDAACRGIGYPPPDPSAELQRQDRQREELRQLAEPRPWAQGGLSQTPPHQKLPPEQPCVAVEQVVLQGSLATETLRTALDGVGGDDPAAGRCLGSRGVTLLLERLQQALIERGFVTSRVQIPSQDLSSGKLVFEILEGRLSRLRSQDGGPLPHLAWALSEGQVLNLRDIEQSSENLQRLPSLQSRLQIEPGQEPGTSDLVVVIEAGRPLRLTLGLDDTGNRSTGTLQGYSTLAWDNPLGLGDMVYVTLGREVGGRDDGPRGTRNAILHFSVPWGYSLLSLTSSLNRHRQTVYGPYESYLYSGSADRQELSLQRVLHRDGRSRTALTLPLNPVALGALVTRPC